MRQDFVHDEVIAELGGTSFMTKQGHVVEGNYKVGDSVLLVFDRSCRRWLPIYKKEQSSVEVKREITQKKEKERKHCRCRLTIVGPSEVKNGEDTSHTVEIEYDKGCNPSSYEGMVPTWEIVSEGKCSGTIIAPPAEWELLWTPNIASVYPYTGEDFCYVTLVASFEGVDGTPECTTAKRVKILGCTCEVTIDLAPGSKVGSGDTVTATKDLSLAGCSSDREEEDMTVSWDVSVLTCVGTCSVEMISEDKDHIVFIPTVEDGDEKYAVFNVHVEVVGPDNVPFCEKDELLYVGCWCDVLANAPSPIATGLVYQATVKGWYHDCTPTERSMAPLTYWFHDCNGNGPICDVQMSNVQEISENPPEYRFDFAVNPLAGSGTVILSVQMGSGEDDVPYCRYDQMISFDCCLKLPGDRLVIIYTEPDDVETIGPGTVVDLWVEPAEDGGCPPFAWSLDGPGEIEVSEDTTSATYTAPDEDSWDNCEKWTIKITCQDACGAEDQVDMTINAVYTNEVAYKKVWVANEQYWGSWCDSCRNPDYLYSWLDQGYNWHFGLGWQWGFDNYNCRGDFVGKDGGAWRSYCIIHGSNPGGGCSAMGTEGTTCAWNPPTCCAPPEYCRGRWYHPGIGEWICVTCGGVYDVRSQWLKEHKCCPGALS